MGGGMSDGGAGFELAPAVETVVNGLLVERTSYFADTDGGATAVRTAFERPKDALAPTITVSLVLNTGEASMGIVWMVDTAMRAAREFQVPTVRIQPSSREGADMLRNSGWAPVTPDGFIARMLASRSTPLMERSFDLA
jgi:hypothetical protein